MDNVVRFPVEKRLAGPRSMDELDIVDNNRQFHEALLRMIYKQTIEGKYEDCQVESEVVRHYPSTP